MSIWSLIVFAAVQGITEFLPISSTAHLQLTGKIMDIQPSPTLEVAVHLGTVFAVIIYFRDDIQQLTLSLWDFIRGKSKHDKDLFFKLFIATLPIIIVGGIASIFFNGLEFRHSLMLIGWTTLIFGVLLYVTDKYGLTIHRIEHISYLNTFLLGVAQVIAIIPGVSRSGITITAMRALGMERSDAARFSMLMAIPTILAAGFGTGVELAISGNVEMTFQAILAAILSFGFALMVIGVLMSWIRNSTFLPFVIYRIILGVIILVIAYGII